MKKTIFEEMGGIYTQTGGCFLSDSKPSEEETKPVCVWGQRTDAICKSINERLMRLYSLAVN